MKVAPLIPTVTVYKELGTGVPATQVAITVHDTIVIVTVEQVYIVNQ